MRLEYVSHSCFVITTGGKRIVFDPWITGTAYNGQWHLYPKPVDINDVVNADVVLISHGHEDHFHEQSLKLINKKAYVFFPYQWRSGVNAYLKKLQFNQVTEAVSFHTYHYGDVKFTYLGYSLESVIVVECEGNIIVNINDALNSNHETAVQFLLEKIKKRWPKIDYLLSGWSGAGYFPNKVHYQNKNDLEVAKIREQYFADNFCRFTKYLQPEIAVPFAPGFVLISDENRWINEIKFPRTAVAEYYRENFQQDSEIKFFITYPGDYFENKSFHARSYYRNVGDDKEIYSNVEKEFAKEITAGRRITYLDEDSTEVLVNKLFFWINKNKILYSDNAKTDAKFSIKLKDVLNNNYLNIYYHEKNFQIKRDNNPEGNEKIIITTSASLLSTNLDREWGGDLLTIGYGIDVEVFDESSLEKNLDIVCVRLISRYPIFRDDMLKHAGRIIKYYLNNPALTNLWITQKIRLRPYVNKYPFNERDHWITYNKCDLCRVCHLPEIDFENIATN
jgi:hypothetical protein